MPDPTVSTTGYARLTRLQARAVLGVVGVVLCLGVAVTLSPLASSNAADHGRPSDTILYRATIERIRAGEGYYAAAAAELTARGYPTRSVFNWRTPILFWGLGKLPTPELGKALLGALSLVLAFLAFEALAREEARAVGRRLACALLLIGPLMPTILGDLYMLPLLWAGVLIGLSVCCYGVNRPWWGLAFGLAALFVRELALPYCVLAAAIAWRQGRRKELAAWLIGLLAWSAFLGWHAWQVSEWITLDARAHRHGWIRFGGAAFVISTAQMNAFLILLPQWATVAYLVAAAVGFAGWNTPLGTRVGLSACLYLAAFAMVGQSFNQYWGAVIAPLLCFGVVRFPASLRDLWRAAF